MHQKTLLVICFKLDRSENYEMVLKYKKTKSVLPNRGNNIIPFTSRKTTFKWL